MITPEEASKKRDREDQAAAAVLLHQIEEVITKQTSVKVPFTVHTRVIEIVIKEMDDAGWVVTWYRSVLYWRPRQ